MENLVTKKGDASKPPRVLIYGVEGVGKSTLGARAPKPVFVSPEGGTDRLIGDDGHPVDEMPGVKTWDDVVGAVQKLQTLNHDFKTVCLDSADWIETLAHEKIIGKSGKTITTVNGGYGAGYRESQQMHLGLIKELTKLREQKNMNIVIMAHAHVKAAKDPSMPEDYDVFEIKCHEFVSSLWREWVDALFFARFTTFVTSAEDTSKARAIGDGSRIIYGSKQPSFQAKNRYGLDPKGSGMSFTEHFWSQSFGKALPPAELDALARDQLMLEIHDMKLKLDEQTRKVVQETIDAHKNNIAQMKIIHKRLKEIVK